MAKRPLGMMAVEASATEFREIFCSSDFVLFRGSYLAAIGQQNDPRNNTAEVTREQNQ